MIHVNEISTIIIVTSILIMTDGTGILSSLVFAHTDSEDSEIDFGTLTNSSEVQVDTTLTNTSEAQGDTSGVELPQQQPQGTLSPPSTAPQQAQDNVTKSVTLDEDSFRKDLLKSCTSTFKCKQDSTSSWDNNTSMQISTTLNKTKLWSGIQGQTISVSPNKDYEVLTHMKLNNWSTASHIKIEGFNQTSKQWY